MLEICRMGKAMRTHTKYSLKWARAEPFAHPTVWMAFFLEIAMVVEYKS
jgi:hypothetical protein